MACSGTLTNAAEELVKDRCVLLERLLKRLAYRHAFTALDDELVQIGPYEVSQAWDQLIDALSVCGDDCVRNEVDDLYRP